MNEILEMVSMTQVQLNETNDEIFENLIKKIKKIHKQQITSAFNRGSVDMITTTKLGADKYYADRYED